MDGEGTAPDDLQVRLNWPGGDNDDARGQGEGQPAQLIKPAPEPALEEPSPDNPVAPELFTAGQTSVIDPSLSRPPGAGANRDQSEEAFGLAGRVERLAAELSGTRARLDTMSEALITLRGLVNERLGDVTQAISRSQNTIANEISESLRRLTPAPPVDVTPTIERAHATLSRQLTEAVERASATVNRQTEQLLDRSDGDLKDQLQTGIERSHAELRRAVTDAVVTAKEEWSSELPSLLATSEARIVEDLSVVVARLDRPQHSDFQESIQNLQDEVVAASERSVTNSLARAGQLTEEAISDTRTQLTAELEQARASIVEVLTGRIENLFGSQQAVANRLGEADQRRHGDTTAQLGELLENQEGVLRRLDTSTTALSSEMAAVGDEIDRRMGLGLERLKAQVADGLASGESEIGGLRDAVAGALEQVADRLESLVADRRGQEDVVEAVADALDDLASRVDELDKAGRSRHERVATLLSELRVSTRPTPVDLHPVTQSLTSLEATVAEMKEALDHQRSSRPDRSLVTAITRIEGRLADEADQRAVDEQSTRTAVGDMAETVGRLAAAQAEDLERIYDAVEASGSTDPSAEGVNVRLSEIERLLMTAREAMTSPAVDLDPVLEQMHGLETQIEALRRRLTVRARPPTLDDATIAAIADAVVLRLPSPVGAKAIGSSAKEAAESGAARTRRRPPADR